MTLKGPRPSEDGSDDAPHVPEASSGMGEGHLADGADDPFDDAVTRGWVPPEERNWRHPSEMRFTTSSEGIAQPGEPSPGAPGTAASAGGAAGTIHHAVHGRRRSVAMALVGTGAAAAVFVGVVLLNSIGSGEGSPSDYPTATTSAVLTTAPSLEEGEPRAARLAAEGLVALSVTTSHGNRQGCGVAVVGDGLVATTADTVLGATTVTATSASGQQERAKVVALDRSSDIALLRVPGDVRVPTFDVSDPVEVGAHAMVMALRTNGGTSGSTGQGAVWTTATIESAAVPLRTGAAAGLTAIAASIAHLAPVPGAVLVQPNGDVIGMLDSSSTSLGQPGASAFLPAQLVVAVSKDLAHWGKVRHGWLDVEAKDAPAPDGASGTVGAQVLSVEPSGASGGVLKAGDVIESVGSAPVTSMAQLRERLYVLGAGTPVELGIIRNGAQTSAEVDLGSSP